MMGKTHRLGDTKMLVVGGLHRTQANAVYKWRGQEPIWLLIPPKTDKLELSCKMWFVQQEFTLMNRGIIALGI